MGRSRGQKRGPVIRTEGLPMPVVPTENKGIMSGPMRKPRRGRIDRRGSLPKPGPSGGFRQPPPGYKYDEIDRLVPIDTPPLGKKPFRIPKDFVCPDPNMNILMSDGSQKKAGDLVVGDLVRTHHEESFELGEYKVEFTEIINNVEKIKLIFDKSEIICSLSHKLYVGDSWKEAKDMVIGDMVSDKKLVSIEDVEDGDVVRITIEDAHTYICEGLLSHNKSPRLPDEPRRIPRKVVGRRSRRPFISCPDPNMNILMSDDSQKKAGDLVIGDLVKTYHEKSFELGNYEVEYVNIVKDVKKIKLTFDESEIVCSVTHKFYVNNSWKEAKDMVIGDEVSGKKLILTGDVEDGEVVHITVKDAHTYICEGLLSHNKRMLPKDFRKKDEFYATQETERVPVKDPTLGGPPEREVPIPKERIRPITRESDPRGGAPFAPDERGMARDRFFERMFDRADERKQQRDMERAERDNVGDAIRSERELRESEVASPGDERQGRRGEGGRRGRRRPDPRAVNTRGRRRRRRDFTRRRSQMEGGRRGRSGREMAEFRDRYVSTLGGGFFS